MDSLVESNGITRVRPSKWKAETEEESQEKTCGQSKVGLMPCEDSIMCLGWNVKMAEGTMSQEPGWPLPVGKGNRLPPRVIRIEHSTSNILILDSVSSVVDSCPPEL